MPESFDRTSRSSGKSSWWTKKLAGSVMGRITLQAEAG
jgi:hypothetical protein